MTETGKRPTSVTVTPALKKQLLVIEVDLETSNEEIMRAALGSFRARIEKGEQHVASILPQRRNGHPLPQYGASVGDELVEYYEKTAQTFHVARATIMRRALEVFAEDFRVKKEEAAKEPVPVLPKMIAYRFCPHCGKELP